MGRHLLSEQTYFYELTQSLRNQPLSERNQIRRKSAHNLYTFPGNLGFPGITEITWQLVTESRLKSWTYKKGRNVSVRAAAKFLNAVLGNGMITSSKHTLNVLRKSSTARPQPPLKGCWVDRGDSPPQEVGVRRYGRT